MINLLLLIGVASSSQAVSPEKVAEMRSAFRALVEISKPTDLEKIRAEMSAGLTPIREEPDGFWTVWAGMTHVRYTRRGDFRGYHCWKVPMEIKPPRSDQQLIAETKTALAAIGFWGDDVKYVVERTPGLDTRVSAQPFIRGMKCLNDAVVEFHEKSGALKDVFVWDRLDYQKYVNAPRITASQALDAAMAAYGGFHPYTAADVGKPTLYFGIPAQAERFDPDFHEIPETQMSEFRNYVAMPLYYIDFVNAGDLGGFGELQCVVVDAISGRPIVIYPISYRSNDRKLTAWKVGDKVAISSKSGKSLGFATRGKPLPVAGVPVWIKIGGKLVDARYERKSKRLWIGGDGAFNPGPELAKHLEQSAAPRRSFARKG
jgi:hypothetical protein